MGINQKTVFIETTFLVPAMDCPSEEQMIRMALSSLVTHSMSFDIPNRKVVICHSEDPIRVLEKLLPLNFGASIQSNKSIDSVPTQCENKEEVARERQVLIWLLALNGAMFFVEIIAGWLAQSAGLMADALDMFADAAVYGVALFMKVSGESKQLAVRVEESFLVAIDQKRIELSKGMGSIPSRSDIVRIALEQFLQMSGKSN